jgi:hypothetical protein
VLGDEGRVVERRREVGEDRGMVTAKSVSYFLLAYQVVSVDIIPWIWLNLTELPAMLILQCSVNAEGEAHCGTVIMSASSSASSDTARMQAKAMSSLPVRLPEIFAPRRVLVVSSEPTPCLKKPFFNLGTFYRLNNLSN